MYGFNNLNQKPSAQASLFVNGAPNRFRTMTNSHQLGIKQSIRANNINVGRPMVNRNYRWNAPSMALHQSSDQSGEPGPNMNINPAKKPFGLPEELQK